MGVGNRQNRGRSSWIVEGAANEVTVELILPDQAERLRYTGWDLRGRVGAAEIELETLDAPGDTRRHCSGAEKVWPFVGWALASGVRLPISPARRDGIHPAEPRIFAPDAMLRCDLHGPILVIDTLLSRIRGRRYGV